jgi:hypothetical protein
MNTQIPVGEKRTRPGLILNTVGWQPLHAAGKSTLSRVPDQFKRTDMKEVCPTICGITLHIRRQNARAMREARRLYRATPDTFADDESTVPVN